MGAPTVDEADVLVVGAGPAGVTLASLLGLYGVCAIVIERETQVLDYPRAVGVDDESLRTFQAFGMADALARDVLQNTPIRYYSSSGKCFAHVKPSERPFGWPRRNNFLQPLLEKGLRGGIGRFASIQMRLGHELLALCEDEGGVSAELSDAEGAPARVRARYVVGCDGGRSTVRRLIGVELTGKTAPDRWLVVDVADDQLDRPYAAVHCHPKSPVLMVPLPHRRRRWEFKLSAEDDEAAVTDAAAVMARLVPLYGETPPPTVERARVYWHHSRIAASFQRGRTFLAGDAAHLQPPFFGQGMNSGIRDVFNLAWKLAAVCRGQASAAVLDTYDLERRDHARAMVDFSTLVGRMYAPPNFLVERLRDAGFALLQRVPGGKEYILQMKYKPMPRYTRGVLAGGSPERRHPAVGRMFMQPPLVVDGARVRLDEAVGAWFAVLGLQLDPTATLTPAARAWWRDLGARFMRIEPPFAVSPTDPPADLIVATDIDGAFRDLRLERPDDEIIVLRPDRYVAAVCRRDGFEAVTQELAAILAAPRAAGA
jgi:3-(3-hydroxy-phenyl)propionate hydroxylase